MADPPRPQEPESERVRLPEPPVRSEQVRLPQAPASNDQAEPAPVGMQTVFGSPYGFGGSPGSRVDPRLPSYSSSFGAPSVSAGALPGSQVGPGSPYPADYDSIVAAVLRTVQEQARQAQPPPNPPQPPPKPNARWTEHMSIVIGCLAVLGSAATIFGTTYSLRGEVSEVKTSVKGLEERSKIWEATAQAVNDLKLQNLQANSDLKVQLAQVTAKLDTILDRLSRLETSSARSR